MAAGGMAAAGMVVVAAGGVVRGQVGSAQARLMSQRELVDFAVKLWRTTSALPAAADKG